VTEFTDPIEENVVTRFKMAEIFQKRGETVSQESELRKIVEIDASAGEDRSDVVRVTAARSALILSEKLFRRFDEVELAQPFERNLQEKQKQMDLVLASLDRLIDYEVGEVTAAATFYMAETFGDFSRSLVESERPADLTGPDLQDYEMVLEEEAYPFEERAIELHEKNLELMRAGVYNHWIEKSLAQLAVVMPGRYAKFEASSGIIESVDQYAYRVPTPVLAPGSERILDEVAESGSEASEDSSGEAQSAETMNFEASEAPDAEAASLEPSPQQSVEATVVESSMEQSAESGVDESPAPEPAEAAVVAPSEADSTEAASLAPQEADSTEAASLAPSEAEVTHPASPAPSQPEVTETAPIIPSEPEITHPASAAPSEPEISEAVPAAPSEAESAEAGFVGPRTDDTAPAEAIEPERESLPAAMDSSFEDPADAEDGAQAPGAPGFVFETDAEEEVGDDASE
jgi:hypothetical protein